MPKANIHPQWYPTAKVICNGEIVAIVGSTKPEIHVDTWSGNHPFFTGTQKIIDTEGRVERFLRKYKMDAPPAPAVSDTAAPAEPPAKTASASTAKGKKKK